MLPSRSGEEGSVGISWKAISSSWVVAAKKTFPPSLHSHRAASPRFGGKPGENQSAKLEYKPISGGVGNVRALVRRKVERTSERAREREEWNRTETTDRFRRKPRFRRDSNLHTLHKIAGSIRESLCAVPPENTVIG